MAEPIIHIPGKRAFTFAAFLVLYEFLTYIANDMIMPGMIQVIETFQASESLIPTSLTVYVLGGASLQIFLGPISDRFGRRPVMLFGALFFTICTLLIACSLSMEQFLWARFFQGMGLCFIAVIGYTTLQEIFAEIDAIRLIAIMANTATIAPLLGPLAGATVLLYVNWRVIFFIIAFFSLLALWGLWFFMPETVGAPRKDKTCIHPVSLKPTNIARNYGHLLLTPPFMTGVLTIGIINVVCLAWIAIAPIMLVSKAELTLMEYGWWQVPVFAALILGNFFLRSISRYWDITRIIAVGSVFAIVGMALPVILIMLFDNSWMWIVIGLTLYFFGMGLCNGPLYRRTLFSTSISKGTASALMSLCTMALLGGGIELSKYIYALHDYSVESFAWFSLAMSGLYGVVLGIFLYFQKREGPIDSDH